MIRVLAHPLTPHSRQQDVSLSQSSSVSVDELTDGRERGRGGPGAKSYECEKAWPSLIHSIYSLFRMIPRKYSPYNGR